MFRNGLVFVDLTTVTDPAKVGGCHRAGARPAERARRTRHRERRDPAARPGGAARPGQLRARGGRRRRPRDGCSRVRGGSRRSSRAAPRCGSRRSGSTRCTRSPRTRRSRCSWSGRGRYARRSTRTPRPTRSAEICARLDHLPLAIELAAARVNLLSAEQIRERLASRLGLLSGGRRGGPARQQTLRDTIAWSYDLLPSEAADLLCRAAVFVGGFTLDAIERVARGAAATPSPELGTLVDQSLLRHDVEAGRFSMLETIREFALEQAQTGGVLAAASECHAAFFADLADLADAGAHGPAEAARLRNFDASCRTCAPRSPGRWRPSRRARRRRPGWRWASGSTGTPTRAPIEGTALVEAGARARRHPARAAGAGRAAARGAARPAGGQGGRRASSWRRRSSCSSRSATGPARRGRSTASGRPHASVAPTTGRASSSSRRSGSASRSRTTRGSP